jgi:hypothetical protein
MKLYSQGSYSMTIIVKVHKNVLTKLSLPCPSESQTKITNKINKLLISWKLQIFLSYLHNGNQQIRIHDPSG